MPRRGGDGLGSARGTSRPLAAELDRLYRRAAEDERAVSAAARGRARPVLAVAFIAKAERAGLKACPPAWLPGCASERSINEF